MRIELKFESNPSELNTHLRRTLAHILRECGLKVFTYKGKEFRGKEMDQEYDFLLAEGKAPADIEERLRKAVETAPV